MGRLVLQTLRPLVKSDPTRQTFRLISGTLVKRTVTDVVPALETTLSGITEVLESLVKSYKTKEVDFVGFQKEYGIQVSLSRRGIMGQVADD
jgi:prefoldin subunit 2